MVVRRAMLAMVPTLIACGGSRIKWVPSMVTHVPDSTSVRYARTAKDAFIAGTSVGWDRGTPRIVTANGDTLDIPVGSRVEVYLKEPTRHPGIGAAIGWAIAGVAMLADCGGERTCGEQDPRPLIGILAGALAGEILLVENWRPVAWPVAQ